MLLFIQGWNVTGGGKDRTFISPGLFGEGLVERSGLFRFG